MADAADAVRRFAPWLLNAHLKDLDDAGRFCPLGTGRIALAPVIAALRDVGYGGWLIVDEESMHVPTDEAFAASRAFLDAAGVALGTPREAR